VISNGSSTQILELLQPRSTIIQRATVYGSFFATEADAPVAALVRMNELVVGPDRAHGVKTPVDGGRALTFLPRPVPDMVTEGILRAQHFAHVRQLSIDCRLVIVHELTHRRVRHAFAAARIVRRTTVSNTGSL
jgi:hypothetical protein